MNSEVTVAVLKGGTSSERDVSLKSGAAVERGLRAAGYHVVPIDVRDTEVPELGDCHVDVAFIALHGSFGEDGGVQALLEAKGIAYVGSGIAASELAMDKVASKDVFVSHGIPTAPYVVIPRDEPWDRHVRWFDKVGLPLVVKPPREGSSVGATMVRRRADLESALSVCYRFDDDALVEKFVRGRELTVGVLDDEPLPIVEIRTGREFYDYDAKYRAPDTEYILEPALGPDHTSEVKATALKAFWALGCEAFSRVDLILGHDGVAYVLEINTIPGFTERSLLPKAAAHVGMSFPELCSRITRLALVKQRDEAVAAGH